MRRLLPAFIAVFMAAAGLLSVVSFAAAQPGDSGTVLKTFDSDGEGMTSVTYGVSWHDQVGGRIYNVWRSSETRYGITGEMFRADTGHTSETAPQWYVTSITFDMSRNTLDPVTYPEEYQPYILWEYEDGSSATSDPFLPGAGGANMAGYTEFTFYNPYPQKEMAYSYYGGVTIMVPGQTEYPSYFQYFVDNFSYDWSINEPTVAPMPFPEFCYITITNTVTITDSMGITSTEVITVDYTAESNLVRNPSFEDGGSSPDIWQPVVGGAVSIVPPFYATNDSSLARNGVDSVYSGGEFELWNDLPLFAGGRFLVGFYARCTSEDCVNPAVIARWNSSPVAVAAWFTDTYQIYSGTIETGGGSTWYSLAFLGEGTTQVDDAFAYPIDENGDLLCDPLYYAPPETEEPEEPPVSGIVPNESQACWECQTPDNWYSIGLWIRWLGCKIHNLFYCALYIWLLNVANWISGVWQKFVTLLAWLPTAGQQFLNWGANAINNLLAWFGNLWNVIRTQAASIYRNLILSVMNSSFIQTVWGWFSWIGAVWDVVKILLSALIEIIHRVYLALIELVRFLVETFLMLRDALSSDIWRINIITEEGGQVDTIAPGDLYAPGPNATKILWLFLSGIGSIDYIVGMFSQFELILVAVVGTMAIGVFMWTARIWHDILPT